MTTYIHIGTSCGTFTEAKPADISSVYLYSGGSVLKNALSSGYSASGVGSSANLVTISDYLFNIKFNSSLVYGSTSRSTARYILGASDARTMDPTVGTHLDHLITTTTPTVWSSWSAGGVGITVTYKEAGTSYTMVGNLSDSALVSALEGLLSKNIGVLTGGNPITSYTQPFYLRKVTPTPTTVANPTGKVYLVWDSNGSTVVEKDIETANVQASDISGATNFNIIVYKTEAGKYSLKIGNGANYISDLNIEYDSTRLPNFSVRRISTNTVYCFDTANPTDETLTSPGFSTLIKRGSKYLVLDGTNFMLKDYWTTGYTLSDLRIKMMFTWTDLTPNSRSTIPGNTEEINRWNLKNSTGGDDANPPVVSLTVAGAAVTVTVAPNASVNEGWAITNTGNIIFVRNGAPVGFLSSDGSTVSVQAGSPTGSGNDIGWSCIKCTIGGDGLCTPP